MTLREALGYLYDPQEVDLSWNGDLVYFNFRNEIEISVWGNYEVGRICARSEGKFELMLAAQPIIRGKEAAV